MLNALQFTLWWSIHRAVQALVHQTDESFVCYTACFSTALRKRRCAVTWIYVSHEAQKWHLSDYPFSTFHMLYGETQEKCLTCKLKAELRSSLIKMCVYTDQTSCE